MYNEGAPDFVIEQGMYYPAATNYGYYCTGFESPGEWENHQMIFGIDGSDVQYAGGRVDNSPYLYYMPSYGYAQSPYNPYNPYIPGASVDFDGPYVGSQQHYSDPHQNTISSHTYIPFFVQPDTSANSSSDPLLESDVPISVRSEERGSEHKLASATAVVPKNTPKPSTFQANSFIKNSERPRTNTSQSKQPGMRGSVSSADVSTPGSTRAIQGRIASVFPQPIDNASTGKLLSREQLEVVPPVSNSFSDFGSNSYASVHKLRPKIYSGRGINDMNAIAHAVSEQNRGPRTKSSKNHLVVKAYTTEAGDIDTQGNIVINPGQYNKDDFKLDYKDAKFFVIKSYSEDDVHKSIKYNVWSSTQHGNKKLQRAYEDAQKIALEKSSGCPIFLFFSVNASGLFCGVAEMVGPVDFHKNVEFWQQDKWSGNFLVKWHIIKDVPNGNFRHIILENNENKPVTNSRDTQEIMQKQGLEMLKIFKDHTAETSLLDDFMYYENRQRIMHEEKSRRLYKTFQSPLILPKLDSTNRLNFLVVPPSNEGVKKITKDDSKITVTSSDKEVCINTNVEDTSDITKEKATEIGDEAKEDMTSTLKIGSLTINPDEAETKAVASPSVRTINQNKAGSKPFTGASVITINRNETESKPFIASAVGDIVTVGSMPVKVNGSVDSSTKILTVGAIPLDPRSLKQ